MHIKKYLFDLGNVFFDWNPRHVLKEIIPDEELLNKFLSEVAFPHLDMRCDAGVKISLAEKEAIEKFPEFETEIKFYYPNHRNMVNGSYQDTIDVFQKIKSYGFPCYVLSNWSDETYEGMEEEYPFLKDFDDKIISGREFLVKPDPQIYRLAMSRFDLVPEETLFIDDREDNIQAAQNLGFQTIHLTDPSTIKSDIKKFLVV
ncbi:HAD family phosphatase [bacterium]|jgi:2-haloacid dehalogenase|nr:HAD family phosphatase [bacterium]